MIMVGSIWAGMGTDIKANLKPDRIHMTQRRLDALRYSEEVKPHSNLIILFAELT